MSRWRTSNVLFDLGGVLLTVDYAATANAFAKLGFAQFANKYAQGRQAALFDAFETGCIDDAGFRAALRREGRLSCSDAAFDAAWNAMLVGFEPQVLKLLRGLRQGYRLYLFSNTNAIHQRRVQELLQRHAPANTLQDFFDGTYFSHAIGTRKPAPEAFLSVLADADAQPFETLFIDDSGENISGAASAGLRTWHVRSPHDLLHNHHHFLRTESNHVTHP